MKTLLIATHNPAKLKEIALGLSSLRKSGLEITSLREVGIKTDPNETGKTFKQNAILKAKYYAKLSGLPTISDDGGLAIKYLNNEPGVKSRLWMGREATDEELIEYTLKRLHGFPKEKRVGYFETCSCFFDPKTKKTVCEQERVYGYFAEKTSNGRVRGYPFRSLFVVDEYGKYYDELSAKEHHEINHRLKAVKRLAQKIKPFLLQ